MRWKKMCCMKMQLTSQKKAHTFQIMSVLKHRASSQQVEGLIIPSIHWHCHHHLFLLFRYLLLTAFFSISYRPVDNKSPSSLFLFQHRAHSYLSSQYVPVPEWTILFLVVLQASFLFILHFDALHGVFVYTLFLHVHGQTVEVIAFLTLLTNFKFKCLFSKCYLYFYHYLFHPYIILTCCSASFLCHILFSDWALSRYLKKIGMNKTPVISGIPRIFFFFWGGGGVVSNFSWGQRALRTGILGQ
jgi:hypothetical protein